VSVIEFVPLSARGRRYSGARKVRLGDAGPDGTLRPDALVRYLQDVASDDWDDAGPDGDDTWVVRRTSVRVAAGGGWPRYGDEVSLTTWCGGSGAAWAERRTDVCSGARTLIETVALWVPVDPSGRPRRLRPSFYDVYGEAAQGRKVSGRVSGPARAGDAVSRPWPLRFADLDMVGHVNNAAAWSALAEVARAPVTWATMTHHGSLEGGDAVTLAASGGRLWLSVDGDVRVAGEFEVA
jgi:acyl-ACP thioesterase